MNSQELNILTRMTGSITRRDHPGDMVRLSREKCGGALMIASPQLTFQNDGNAATPADMPMTMPRSGNATGK